jgi:hypothetical protein
MAGRARTADVLGGACAVGKGCYPSYLSTTPYRRWGKGCQHHAFLASALEKDEWLASHSVLFTPQGKGRRASPDTVAEREILPCPKLNHGNLFHSLVTILTSLIHYCGK